MTLIFSVSISLTPPPGVTYLTMKIVGEDEPWYADQADFVIVL